MSTARRRTLATGAAVLATAVTLPLVTAPADAAYPGHNGRVAVEMNKQIFTLTASGTGRVSLGAGTGPRWSPDGRKLAYAKNGAIWVMNPNGTSRVQITATTLRAVNPSWSPDGKRIVFSTSTTSSESDRSLAVVNLGSWAVTRLTRANDGCAFDPTWAKTGRYVVYSDQCAAGGEAIKKVDTATGRVTTVVSAKGITAGGLTYFYTGGRPDVSPDGTRVLWNWYDSDYYDQGLATVNLSGRDMRFVPGASAMLGAFVGDAAYSPDGKQVITGYGWENSQVKGFCITACSAFYYDVPNEDWSTSLDWQPLR